MTFNRIGVGFVGAGPVVQAIHLPTLARLSDKLLIAHIMDPDAEVASTVARTTGAAWSSRLETLLDDPAVEIVAICSPSQFHADQVVAAMHARKRLVFCEKPLASTLAEADMIRAASRRTGVPLAVGAMHCFDPTWTEVEPHIQELMETAHSVRSSIILPPNDRFESWAAEIFRNPSSLPPAGATDWDVAEMLKMAVLGLAIHDLPLVRHFVPEAAIEVTSAHLLFQPFAYAVTCRSRGRIIDITGAMQPFGEASWELEAVSADTFLQISFTPSFVHAGSATATLIQGGNERRFGGAPFNGYEGEWVAMYKMLQGDDAALPGLDTLIADIRFALHIAEGAAMRERERTK